jgi:hypothetical protein
MADGSDMVAEGVVSGPSGKPPQFVAAVIDERDDLEAAVGELVELGIARESLGILQGQRGADAIAGRHGEGIRSWLQRARESLSDEEEFIDRFEEAARQGHFVIGVPLPDRSTTIRDQVRTILSDHGAHSIVSSTRWTHSGDE